MKNLFFFAILLFSVSLYSQEQAPEYVMFQSIVLSPNSGQGQQLRAGIKAHNQKYHTEGTNTVNVWSVASGPGIGNLHWIKGPMTWTDMDNPIGDEEHMEDWRTNIMPHAEMESMDFWRLNADLSYMPEGFQPRVMVVRYFDLKQGKGNNAEHVIGTLVGMYKAKGYDMGIQVFSNQANADGKRDWAICWFHDSFASMDKQRNGWSNYEEMYGMDSREFFENWNETTDFKGMEIFRLVTGLSAATNFTSD
jgi:hypothetical protein